MHVIVIKRAIYEKDPWVAQTLYKAFCEAKDLCMRELYDTNILRVSLPWTSAEYEDTRDLMTADYWPYGLTSNRMNLETLHDYLYEQGLIKQKLNLDELFRARNAARHLKFSLSCSFPADMILPVRILTGSAFIGILSFPRV